MRQNHTQSKMLPIVVVMAISTFGLVSLLLVDHGPWNRPHLESTAGHYASTESAGAAGATVTPTEPKPLVEPTAPGPKPAQPINPVN
jgi:hypothetical protein